MNESSPARRVAFAALAVASLMGGRAMAASFPDLVIPDGLGVNIHFRGEPARELDMLRDGGFKFVRMDFVWSHVERTKGVYTWRDYDQLTEGLIKRGIRILYILDYSNKLYEKERSVLTSEGRAAFAAFAAAAAARYRGKDILWELWNEPNISFWKPQPSADAYMKLAHATIPAIRKADPDATVIAPATSEVALSFLEECFKRGMLDLVDGVTVHPYRRKSPESVEPEYRKLRALIARYRPDKPDLPVLSGEWGYSAAWGGFDRARQGLYLPRELLTNVSLGVPVSIWYDWRDDGPDPKESEHNFGTVTRDMKPKPAYEAMQLLAGSLGGARFVKRLESEDDERVLAFVDASGLKLAAWSLGEAREVELFRGNRVRLTEAVQYAAVPPDERRRTAEACWTIDQRCHGVRGGARRGEPLAPGFVARLVNRFDRRISARVEATPDAGVEGAFFSSPSFALAPGEVRTVVWAGSSRVRNDVGVAVKATVDGMASASRVEFVCVNPVSIAPAPYRGGVQVVITHSDDERFEGTLELAAGAEVRRAQIRLDGSGKRSSARSADGATRIEYRAGRGRLSVVLPVKARPEDWLRARILDGDATVADSGRWRLAPLGLDADTARAHNDGDAKVEAKFALTSVKLDRDAPAETGMRLTYRYAEGWKFVRIAPRDRMEIAGRPYRIGVWVKGTATKDVLRMRIRDANGRTFQPGFGRLEFDGWRYLTARLDDPHVGTWGGKPDVTDITYPIVLDTAILIDGTKQAHEGTVDLAGFALIYRE